MILGQTSLNSIVIYIFIVADWKACCLWAGSKGGIWVRKVIQMLKDELELTMALSGCPRVKDITRSHVRTEHEKIHSLL